MADICYTIATNNDGTVDVERTVANAQKAARDAWELTSFLRRIRSRFAWPVVRLYNWIEARYRASVEREAQRRFERGWV